MIPCIKNNQTRRPGAQKPQPGPLQMKWASTEPTIYQALKVLRYTHLPPEFVLALVHAGQCTNMCEDVLQSIGKLEGVNIAETELDVRVNRKFDETKNFTTKMERVSEA